MGNDELMHIVFRKSLSWLIDESVSEVQLALTMLEKELVTLLTKPSCASVGMFKGDDHDVCGPCSIRIFKNDSEEYPKDCKSLLGY